MPASAPKLPLILCIDDSDVALKVRRLVLTTAGYSILTATSAEEGFELFQEHPIDLVVADHFLSSGTTGTEVARQMKQCKPQIPILIVSASAEMPPGLDFTDGFLSKATGTDALFGAVTSLLQARGR